MPLHDWSELKNWEGFHSAWMHEIQRELKASLPRGYRAFLGSTPSLTLSEIEGKPDVTVADSLWPRAKADADGTSLLPAPDYEFAVTTLEEDPTVMVLSGARIVAVVELVSPGNKDRPERREKYGGRYRNYLAGIVNLMIVDVHRRPFAFSFAQFLATAYEFPAPVLPTPSVVSYGVSPLGRGDGSTVDLWQRPLEVGKPLPALPLTLCGTDRVMVNLEPTYARAAADNYLDDPEPPAENSAGLA